MQSETIIKVAANALNEKKARDIKVVKIGNLTVIAEYFIFATATSSTHVRALADEVEEKLTEAGLEPHHIEGRTSGWILLDYGDVVVHVFNRENREFYSLDHMWSDGEELDLNNILVSAQEE